MGTTNSRVGFRENVFAELEVDNSTTLTYKAKRTDVVEAINFDVAPQNADPDVQYAEDVESDVLYPDPEFVGTIEAKEIPLALRAWMLGHTIDTNGVMVEKAGDQGPYFAYGFKSKKRNGADRYVWLYKCRASEMSETYRTQEGKTQTRQTDKIQITAIKRTHDGEYRAQVDSDTAAFATAAATFFDAPYAAAYPAG
jgi:phi13 family phage major tail protein